MPTIDIRKISGTEAPARPTISPVVKKRLNAGATCATPGMMTPNRPSWPCCSCRAFAAFGMVAMASPFGDAQRVGQGLRVVGEHPARVGPGRLGARPDPAVVEPQDAVARGQEVVHLEHPGLVVVGETVDEDDGL